MKYLRERSSETLAEVSGAVEINEEILERIEDGEERPSEEILMLLISHFNMQDNEAVSLWELAGYDPRDNPGLLDNVSDGFPPEAGSKPVIMLLAVDVRTQYSDGIDITANKAGLVMTFTQAGAMDHPQPVARVGMSLQQAAIVSDALTRALLSCKYQRPKGLPESKRPSSQSDDNLKS